MSISPEVREASAEPPAETPGQYIRSALDRLSLALRLVDRAQADARSAGITGPTLKRRARQARHDLRHLAAGIERDATAAEIEVTAA